MASPSHAPQALTLPAIAKADLIEGMAKGMAVLESFDTERQRLNATLAAQRRWQVVLEIRHQQRRVGRPLLLLSSLPRFGR